jgi:hypothetical protein
MNTYEWTSTAIVVRRFGPEIGFPADISYDVEVNIPGGDTLLVESIQPIDRRRDRRRIEIEALRIGQAMIVASTADYLTFTGFEKEAVEDCPDAAPRPQMMMDQVTGQMVPVPESMPGVPVIVVDGDGNVVISVPPVTAQDIISGISPSGSTPSGSLPAGDFGELQFNQTSNSMLIPLL